MLDVGMQDLSACFLGVLLALCIDGRTRFTGNNVHRSGHTILYIGREGLEYVYARMQS